MKKLILLILLVIPFLVSAQDYPKKSDRLVNDYTGTLSSSEVKKLESLLVKYDQESSVQISIVMLKTLDGYDISDYAFGLGEKWGIGHKGKDNGAVVLVAMKEHKMWIATGYGLEPTLTDALCKRIIENELKPNFRNNNYYGGLKAGADAMILATRGEYKGEGPRRGKKKMPAGALVSIIIMLILVGGMKMLQVRRYAGVNHIGFWAAWMLLNSAGRRHGGYYGNFSGGSGGFGSSGGFGGFGGGSFGGGGAGGSW